MFFLAILAGHAGVFLKPAAILVPFSTGAMLSPPFLGALGSAPPARRARRPPAVPAVPTVGSGILCAHVCRMLIVHHPPPLHHPPSMTHPGSGKDPVISRKIERELEGVDRKYGNMLFNYYPRKFPRIAQLRIPPHTRRWFQSVWCPWLPDADWRSQSDAVPGSPSVAVL